MKQRNQKRIDISFSNMDIILEEIIKKAKEESRKKRLEDIQSYNDRIKTKS